MAKKKKQVSELKFLLAIAVIVVLVGGIFYLAVLKDRLTVQENGFTDKPLISPDHKTYNTEFCASRLTDLAHEIHFIEKEISAEKDVLGKEELLREQEQEVIEIEQRELQEVRQEFDRYISSCDQFDEKPTSSLCDKFLQEAKDSLDAAQKNADTTTGLKHIQISLKDLGDADRIYRGLQEACEGVE